MPHLNQRVKLPIAAGDPWTFDPVTITVRQGETVTEAKLEVYPFREDDPLMTIPAENLDGPGNLADGLQDFTCRIPLTGAQTQEIGTKVRRFKARCTIGGQGRTFAIGYMWCEA